MLVSCKNEIPYEMRESIHGAWAVSGYTEAMQHYFSEKEVLGLMGDSLRFLVVDPLFTDYNQDTVITIIEDIRLEGYVNVDSITESERRDNSCIWVLEECYVNGEYVQHPVKLFYDRGLFVSEYDGNGVCKFIETVGTKDVKLKYGIKDKNGNIVTSRNLECLFKGYNWFYERYDSNRYWGSDVIDAQLRIFNNDVVMKDITSYDLHERTGQDEKVIFKNLDKSEDIDYYEGNSIMQIDKLTDYLFKKYPDKRGKVGLFDAEWTNDTVYLHDKVIDQGESYFLTLNRRSHEKD